MRVHGLVADWSVAVLAVDLHADVIGRVGSQAADRVLRHGGGTQGVHAPPVAGGSQGEAGPRWRGGRRTVADVEPFDVLRI